MTEHEIAEHVAMTLHSAYGERLEVVQTSVTGNIIWVDAVDDEADEDEAYLTFSVMVQLG